MSDVLTKVQDASVRGLSARVQDVLSDTELARRVLVLNRAQDTILGKFVEVMNERFAQLAGYTERAQTSVNFESLSLVQEEELEVMVAVEGMVAAARNEHLAHFISFNTRLNALLVGRRIDESSNPLDPQQIMGSFQDAIAPLQLEGQEALSIYRVFNAIVLRELHEVLREGNQILIDHGVIPDLGLDGGNSTRASARSAPRDASEVTGFGVTPGTRDSQTELFSIMQNLLHRETAAPAPRSAFRPANPNAIDPGLLEREFTVPDERGPGAASARRSVQTVDQSQLMEILSRIQTTLESGGFLERAAQTGKVPTNIAESLGAALVASGQGAVQAIDRHSSDVINLVTMLYEAIWQDESVPIPIKELIGRTQITIIKVALSDTTFFNREDHPARAVLNEFAASGIGWAEVENLEEDPLYDKMQSLVIRITDDYDPNGPFFETLLKDFRTFRAREAARAHKLEQRILKAQERQERLEDIHQLVSQKIEERILGRQLHEFVQELLDGPFHRFMVMLVLKEGPGGNAWKQAINTIDVLLWSVQPHKQTGDAGRLETVNPRLLNNLRKAFRIANLEAGEIDSQITRLREVQATLFNAPVVAQAPAADAGTADGAPESAPTAASANASEEHQGEPGPDAMRLVDGFTVGTWVEFQGGANEANLRCKLAAKINAIDKFIFVNRQGVKVVEKTRIGLANELADGTVRVISDGLLFSRALESVIGTLRETQNAQQTGSAYQPNPQPAA